MIVLCCVLVPASAFSVSQSQEKQHTASAPPLFRNPGFDQKLSGTETFQRSPDPAREAATNAKLVSRDVIAERTGRRLAGVGSVKDKVQVAAEGQRGRIAAVGVQAEDDLTHRVLDGETRWFRRLSAGSPLCPRIGAPPTPPGRGPLGGTEACRNRRT